MRLYSRELGLGTTSERIADPSGGATATQRVGLCWWSRRQKQLGAGKTLSSEHSLSCATLNRSSRRIELRAADHFFADAAGFAEGGRQLGVIAFRVLSQQPSEFLVKKIADEFRRVTNRRASLIEDFHFVGMLHALGDHQPVDAVGGEIFHVAIKETRTLAVEHAVAVANDGPNCGARSG